MNPVWLAQVAHHARALRDAPSEDMLAAVLAVPDQPALLAARLALVNPSAPFAVSQLLDAYEARERDREAAAAAVDLHAESRAVAARLRAALAKGTAEDLRELWDACDAHLGRGRVPAPRERGHMVAVLARRGIVDALDAVTRHVTG